MGKLWLGAQIGTADEACFSEQDCSKAAVGVALF